MKVLLLVNSHCRTWTCFHISRGLRNGRRSVSAMKIPLCYKADSFGSEDLKMLGQVGDATSKCQNNYYKINTVMSHYSNLG